MMKCVYDTSRLKFLGRIIPGQSPPSDSYNNEGLGLPFIQGSGEFSDNFPSPDQYCSKPSKIAEPGDYLISVRAPVGELNQADQKIGLGRGIAAFRPNESILINSFTKYALIATKHLLHKKANGSTFEAVTADQLGSLLIPIPPQNSQKRIVSFLEGEITNIESLVTKKQRLLELLEEKRSALTTRITTKGVGQQSSLKDSGIPTVGEIPGHWEVVPNRAVFEEKDIRSVNGSEELLSVSHKTGVTPRSEKDVNMFKAESLEEHKFVKEGDFVINTMWAWMGAVGVSPRVGLVSPSYHVYRLTGKMIPEYADLLYRTPPYVAEMGRHSKGVWKSRHRLYPDVFLRMDTILPPKSEQKAVVEEFHDRVKEIEKLNQRLNNIIDLLEEKRQALITAAVTGQLDLSDWEPPKDQELPA